MPKPIKGVANIESGRPRQPERLRNKEREGSEETDLEISWDSEPGAIDAAIKRGDLSVEQLIDDFTDEKGNVDIGRLESIAENLLETNIDFDSITGKDRDILLEAYEGVLEDAENDQNSALRRPEQYAARIASLESVIAELGQEVDRNSEAAMAELEDQMTESEQVKQQEQEMADVISLDSAREEALELLPDDSEDMAAALEMAEELGFSELAGMNEAAYQALVEETVALRQSIEAKKQEVQDIQESKGFFGRLFIGLNSGYNKTNAELGQMELQYETNHDILSEAERLLADYRAQQGGKSGSGSNGSRPGRDRVAAQRQRQQQAARSAASNPYSAKF